LYVSVTQCTFRSASSYLSHGGSQPALHYCHYHQNINNFLSTCKWSGKKDCLIRQLHDNCLWMRRRTRRFDVRLLYISSVFISWGTKRKRTTTTGHSVFHYWIVVVTLHNTDFTCKFPCLCFTCILLVELLNKVGNTK
jgi:hypothetical protein